MKINSCFLCVFLLSVPVESVTVMAADLSPVSGNGKVNLSMSLEVPTCKVSVENTVQSFTVSSGVDNKIMTLPNAFTVENCKGDSLDFKVTFSNPVPVDYWWGPAGYAGLLCNVGSDCPAYEDEHFPVVFYIIIPDGTKGISGYFGRVPDSSTGQTVTITPDLNHYTFNANTEIPIVSLANAMQRHPGRISGSYTYIFSFK
ncbi:hypothetical protein HIX57_004720 [Salmonella enterica]|nr:hypothetical protein [Salmonella enterica]EGG4253812.1 hypothetical protein [Salmonella enterica]EGG4263398.1 hypothetical protein [Salmonella enterica]EGG4290563.1 hypothetical protein [Salmonella enterica]HCT4903636.1 hypothetical protein [Salmonella enterica]